MLHELTITNFVVLAHVHIEFGAGLNVLTGETGAGKSIIVDAISRVLGSRGGADDVRAGTAKAHIEAVFTIAEPAETLSSLLSERGLIDGDGGRDTESLEIVLSRDIRANGRSVGRVNGHAISLQVLTIIGGFLLDIHGQNEHLSLLEPGTQLLLLDSFGRLDQLRRDVENMADQLGIVRGELQTTKQDERDVARRIDLLRYQLNEIAQANVQPGEDEDLRQQRRLLLNAEVIASKTGSAFARLAGADDAPGAEDQLGEAYQHLDSLVAIDPSLSETQEMLADATALVGEVVRSLRAYVEFAEFNPHLLTDVEERLDLIRSLQRKYGETIEAVDDYNRAATEELDGLLRRDAHLEELSAAEKDVTVRLGERATSLSRARRQMARKLAAAVAEELDELELPATFQIAVQSDPDPDGVPWKPDDAVAIDKEPKSGTPLAWGNTGIDRVEFRIAPNAGEPVKPLRRIASGGEMSRILLALKSILSRADATPTLIFDEIDAGVGGRSGRVLGEKLAELAVDHQVLCVTHLPQLAVYGHTHFLITKQEKCKRTATIVQTLTGNDRVSEIAAMLGGSTTASLKQAREMLCASVTR